MLVGFPAPLFGLAFAPLYRLERLDPRGWRLPAPLRRHRDRAGAT
jgi:hypothetical protein